jgi:integrase
MPVMASLRKIPGCRNWIACFTLVDGRRTQRSTRETKRKEAQKIADHYEDAARKKMTALHVQRVITSLYKDITGVELPNGTVKSYIEAWVKRKKPEVSKSTAMFYDSKAKLFIDFLGDRTDTPIAHISGADILAFRDKEAERVGSKTVNHGLKFLRMVFKSAKQEGYLVDNPCDSVGVLKNTDRTELRAFTMPELKSLLSQADDEWKSLIYFGLYTGQRLKDLALLTWQNIDTVQNEIRLKTSKTNRQQIIPIAAPLKRHIETLPVSDDPKQPIHIRAHKIVTKEQKTGTLSRMFYELMAGVGLVAERDHHEIKKTTGSRRGRSEVSFHALRHTATSLMKNAGIGSAIVQEFIGHDSPAISANYTHIETSALKKAADSMPDILN